MSFYSQSPYGIEFSVNAVMPKVFFGHSRSEHMRFKQMPLTVSLDSLIFR